MDRLILPMPSDDRLFIVEQDGYIRILNTDGTSSLFLDIDSKVKSTGGEQGLLGLAFDPNYAENGYFYVNYTNNTGTGNTVIARYSRNAINPNIADVGSEVILMNIVQPFTNHNGGNLEFGPDGYLYIGTGDGGVVVIRAIALRILLTSYSEKCCVST
ncbi:MAG: PQQ-dependent sugar dehydrogenase [Bacteroidetes bacterium]|nr:PQQ-dependent sugar dehydrogenase [Bacteroidota bacterium]